MTESLFAGLKVIDCASWIAYWIWFWPVPILP